MSIMRLAYLLSKLEYIVKSTHCQREGSEGLLRVTGRLLTFNIVWLSNGLESALSKCIRFVVEPMWPLKKRLNSFIRASMIGRLKLF